MCVQHNTCYSYPSVHWHISFIYCDNIFKTGPYEPHSVSAKRSVTSISNDELEESSTKRQRSTTQPYPFKPYNPFPYTFKEDEYRFCDVVFKDDDSGSDFSDYSVESEEWEYASDEEDFTEYFIWTEELARLDMDPYRYDWIRDNLHRHNVLRDDIYYKEGK